MNIKYLWDDLRLDLKDRELILVGIGKYFDRIYIEIENRGLEHKIFGLADNDICKQGIKKQLGEKSFIISALKNLVSINENTVILICPFNYEDILENAEKSDLLKNTTFYIGKFLLQYNNVRKTNYIFDDKLKEIMIYKKKNENIGMYGENLSITVLSCNRAELTIRLIKSIEKIMKDFRGELLIGDNGSEKSELDRIKQELSDKQFDFRIIEFGKNLGVGNGRNKLNADAKKDWILQLDNDMYFFKNTLEIFQNNISQLGCHFLSLPYYDIENNQICSYGGFLGTSGEKGNEILKLGGLKHEYDEITSEKEWMPMLCTFLSGGAGLLKKETFFKCGGYNANMLVGYEDIEFSLRIFQEGYKIGNAGTLCLIHNHKRINGRHNGHYEKNRFCVEQLEKSAKVIEEEYAIKLWTEEKEMSYRKKREELEEWYG